MAKTNGNNNRKNQIKSTTDSKCNDCTALCCRDFTLSTTKPRTRDEIDEMCWYLRMDTARVFVRNYRWHYLFDGNCIYLTKNNLCKIYDRRPPRCRRHDSSFCEKNGDFFDTLITTPEELMEYLDAEKLRR